MEQRKARIRYQPLGLDEFRNHTNPPYLIEPSIWSDSVYVIAYSEETEKITLFKIERIDTAALRGESFDLPENFDDQEMLKHAWGIWFKDKAPVTAKLRFAPSVTRRVKESIWHPLETVTDLDDGGCLGSAEVAEWREMLPWIRGWGADVEVLAPDGLRKSLEREARKMAELYQIVARAESKNLFYAHTKDGADESEWQPLLEHLTRVADYAADFGRDANLAELAKAAGMIHDLGKYSKEFQARLRGSKIKVDHATAGAKELTQTFKGTPQEAFALLLAYCVSGHHIGLLDYGDSSDLPGDGTLKARLKTDLCDYSTYKNELDVSALAFPKQFPIRPLKGHWGFSLSFMTRMIYSALVDADFQETEEFMHGKKPRGGHEDISALREKLSDHLRKFENPASDINRKRTETLTACREKAAEKPGFFKLIVPIGGGKTRASMTFALNHAAAHGLKRIIYVIPFTTIIEQNAGVFKDILGEENVLEHHSNFDWEQKKREAGA